MLTNNHNHLNTLFLFLIRSSLILAGSIITFAFFSGVISLSSVNRVFNQPETFWYLSRSSGIIAYILLWISIALGLVLTTGIARDWKMTRSANNLHQFISLFGLIFVGVHSFVLVFDAYIDVSLLNVLIPFSFFSFQPVMVGIGQIALYAWIVVILSFYIRKKIGRKTWRVVHYFSFLAYLLITIHGFFAGSDTSEPWMLVLYIISFSTTLFLVTYRILLVLSAKSNLLIEKK